MVREIADKVKKVEISIIGEGWEWLGKLDQESIDELCAFADKLSDRTHLLLIERESRYIMREKCGLSVSECWLYHGRARKDWDFHGRKESS